jgi:hypothetical protein
VHTRLLRTSGASFSYASGRTQADVELPWVGVGRQEGEFEADRRALSTSIRPLSSPRLGSPRRHLPSSSDEVTRPEGPWTFVQKLGKTLDHIGTLEVHA